MKISVLSVGEIEGFYIKAIKEYEKRLSRYCKINNILYKTETELLKSIDNNSYTIVLTNSLEQLSSEEFAEKINKYQIYGKSNISFVINSKNVKADETISLSNMSLSIGLEAVLIYEQIYRAYRIINNHSYHK